ncbi:MAG TPA: formimidoylglutamate deiminase [Kineosporiaceae bacterium]|nr:formimidoylglutamate deiminase [Kineosporiaceae bacterium]
MSSWWCEHAWLPGGPAERVRIEAGPDGRITAVSAGADPSPEDQRMPGLVLPGFANTHSHAFHRALRGRTQSEHGTFWTWRDRMYALADRLDPDTYRRLATAVYAEMVLAGVTTVGEFHYLHHDVGGARYGDPNAMGEALREAARAAGLRLTLLDACYLRGGIDVPLEGVQRRFDDGDAEGWANRVSLMSDDEGFRVAAAVHSVRAVPADQFDLIVEAAVGEDGLPRPLHVHLSEQPAENRACLDAYGVTPTRLLHDHGVLGEASTAVHATHLTVDDICLLGDTRTTICICPTTERDLGDGIGPARALADAGSPIALGSDQHVVVDLLAESHALEMNERLKSGRRGRFTPAELVAALAPGGHAALGWHDVGKLEVGQAADLVAVRLDTRRTAGSLPGQALMVASGDDVDTVVVAGRTVVRDGRHLMLDGAGAGVPRLLADAVTAAWGEV